MTYAFRCNVCDSDPVWRIDRRGDAVVGWACDDDLSTVLHNLQRDWEITELVVRNSVKLNEAVVVG